MRSILLLFLSIAFLVGLASATVILGNVVSTLGIAFLAMIAVIAMVVAAAGNKATFKDDAS